MSETIRVLTVERDRLREEGDALHKKMALLEEQEAKTAAALTDVTVERDIYHGALLDRLKKEFTMTDEEMEEMLSNRIPLEEAFRLSGLDVFLAEEDDG